MNNDAEKRISEFLDKHKDIKKKKEQFKEQFKELWNEYIATNTFSHKAKVFLVQGEAFASSDLLWEYICNYFSGIKSIEDDVKEEFKGNEIPTQLLELFVFLNDREKSDTKIRSLENQKLRLESDIRIRDNKIKALQAEIEHLNNEIAEQKRLREVVSKDERQKIVETYQKIADALNHGYETFIEAKDMNMSLELGEVLRDQLCDIYSVLSKYGVKLEA